MEEVFSGMNPAKHGSVVNSRPKLEIATLIDRIFAAFYSVHVSEISNANCSNLWHQFLLVQSFQSDIQQPLV